MIRVAVTSRSFSRHPILRQEVLDRYSDVTFNDEGLSLVGDALIDYLRGHNAAITALETIDDALLTALPDLKVIGKYGVGYDMIDMEALIHHGVKIGWTGGVNCRSVSELVISMAIDLLRHVTRANREVRSGTWRQHKGAQLSDRTVGIVGCGHVGKDLAGLLKAFGCRVLANDIKDFPGFYEASGVESMDLDDLLREADVVTLHLPNNETTRNILTPARLDLMGSECILINTARGGLIDEVELKARLKDGRLAAAAFDVFGVEPPQDPELLGLENFLVTPHIGGAAEEAILAMGRAAIDGLSNNRLPERGVYPEGW